MWVPVEGSAGRIAFLIGSFSDGFQPPRRSDGLCSLRAVAERLNVSSETIRYWVIQSWLKPSDRGSHGRPLWFKLDRGTLSRLRSIKRKHTRKGSSRAAS